MIILPRTGINIAEKVAKKLYMSLINTEIMKNIKPSLAIGITNILYDDTVENVLEKARNEMQKASKERYDRVSKA